MKDKTTNYIFYLQNKTTPDAVFMTMSEILNSLGIKLVPVTSENISVMSKLMRSYLIVVRNDLSTQMNFDRLKKTYLDGAMNSNRLVLFDVSSFSEIDHALRLTGKGVYKFVSLPANLKNVASKIALDYFNDRNKNEEWPGGKRAKLPSLNSNN